MSDEEAKTLKWPGWAKIIAGSAVALGSAFTSYYLLDTQPQFNGTNAIALFTIGLASALMIVMSDFIQIIEWGSLKIQTNEYNKKARETLASLRSAQVTAYRNLIRLTINMQMPMRDKFASDNRVAGLYGIASDIEDAGIKDELHTYVTTAARDLATEIVKSLQDQRIALDISPYDYKMIIRESGEWIKKVKKDKILCQDTALLGWVECNHSSLYTLSMIIESFSEKGTPAYNRGLYLL